MSRCGCTSQQCSCVVTSGDSTITVTGNGSVDAPYEISADAGNLAVTDTDSVDLELAGTGTSAEPYQLTADVRIDPDPANLLAAGPAGLSVGCEPVQDCIGEALGDGLEYDSEANSFDVFPSGDEGNAVTIGSDRGVYAQGVQAAIETGCGLTGTGTPDSPLTIAKPEWEFGCPPAENGQSLGCADDGLLYAPPVQRVWTPTFSGGALTVTPPDETPADGYEHTFELTLTNPDDCREMRGLVYITCTPMVFSWDVAEVQQWLNGDRLHRYRNDSGARQGLLHQMVATERITIAPGGTQTIAWRLFIGVPEGSGHMGEIACTASVMGVSQ